MKNILSILFILFSVASFGQSGFPNNPTQGQVYINNNFLGAVTAQKGLVGGVFMDTTAMNAASYVSTTRAIICYSISDDAYFWRNGALNKWIMFIPTGNPQTDTTYWKTTGNYQTNNIPFLGLISNYALRLGTNNTVDMKIPAGGIPRVSDPVYKYLVMDTTGEHELGYADGGSGGTGWSLTGNSGTDPSTNFIGTTDNNDLVFKRNNTEEFRLGTGVLNVTNNFRFPLTTSSTVGVIYQGTNRLISNYHPVGSDGDNLFMGKSSGNFTMAGTGIQSSYLTGFGSSVFLSNTTGFRNAAFGTYVLQNNTTGFSNNGFGHSVLQSNITGFNNSAFGTRTLVFNTAGTSNNAFGTDALFANTTGNFNSAFSIDALYRNTTGSYNSAFGDSTFWISTTGIKNTAIGSRAGYYLGDTYPNFATVKDSMVTFLGADASRDSSISNTTALKNLTVIGYNAKGFANNQVVLGNDNVTTTLLKGNVGIGTTTPDSLLDVRGGVKLPNLYSSTNATDSMMVVNSTGGVGYRSIPSGGGGGSGNYLDSFWRVSGIDSNYYRINGVTYAVLDSTGGGGGTYTADAPINITGTVISADTSKADGKLATYSDIQGRADTSTVINSGEINWPGALYSTPTTASIAGHKISFAPALESQSAYYVLGNHTGSSAAPTFGKLNVLGINATGTASSTTYLRGDGVWGTVATNADSTAARIVRGTYAQRPTSPDTGQVFYQTDRLKGEWTYDGTKWNFNGSQNNYVGYNQYIGTSSSNGYNISNTGTVSGTAANLATSSYTGVGGVLKMSTGTTTTGLSTQFLPSSIETTDLNPTLDSVIYYIEGYVMVPVLSDGTNTFTVLWGSSTSTSSISFPAFGLRYSSGINSGKWQSITRQYNSASLTTKDAGVSVVAGQWYKLAAELDGFSKEIRFYVNDVLVTTHTSSDNLLYNGTINWGVNVTLGGVGIVKSAGTTNADFYCDYQFAYITRQKY